MGTILVPLDGSDLSAQALPYASTFGKLLSAEVRLLHVLTASDELDFVTERERLRPSEVSAGVQQAHAYAAAYLEEQAVPLRQQGLSVQTEVVVGSPHQIIVEAADQCDATLVVMATHGRGSVGRLLVGSVAHKVLRLTKHPLLAIRGASPQPPELGRILVPLDGSSHAREALPMALNLAKRSGAGLVLLTVLPARYGLHPALLPPPTEGELHEERERLLAGLSDIIPERPGVKITTTIGEGFVEQAICREADAQKVDLIVMTSHGYTGPRGFASGSVTDKVLHGTSVPTLIVPNRLAEG
jgi:nucleotide-binding universal stress UspA family protein